MSPAQDDDVAAGKGSASAINGAGVWLLKIDVNMHTSICCVNLSCWECEQPVPGTNDLTVCNGVRACVPDAQETLIKLLTGMFQDASPLSFRSEHEKDRVTLDPYYKVAPGWSTLSGGSYPRVVAPPAEFAEKMIKAVSCVPRQALHDEPRAWAARELRAGALDCRVTAWVRSAHSRVDVLLRVCGAVHTQPRGRSGGRDGGDGAAPSPQNAPRRACGAHPAWGRTALGAEAPVPLW